MKDRGVKSKIRPSKDILSTGSSRGFRSKLTDGSGEATGSSRGFRSKLAVGSSVVGTHIVEEAASKSSEEMTASLNVNEAHDNNSDSEESDSSMDSNKASGDGSVSGCDFAGKQDKATVTGRSKRRRYILFLGNLPVSASREDVVSHFKKKGVPTSELRLLTHKDSGKSRGCGFMELDSNAAMYNALKFHRSKFQGKNINVEVTCGGGGKGETRRKKIQDKNRKLRLKKSAANPVKHNIHSS